MHNVTDKVCTSSSEESVSTDFTFLPNCRVSLFAIFLLVGVHSVLALSGDLQGLSKGSATNGWNAGSAWSGGNLQDWSELDYIPCRISLSGSPRSNQLVTVSFPHLQNGVPGFQNLYFLSNSANIIFDETPVLSATPGASERSYSMRVTVTDAQTGFVYFYSRLAAGAHLNVGSSLQLSGQPSLSPLQVHKPGAGPGSPNLAVSKTGPTIAAPNEVISYNLTFTNKATGTNNTAIGVQMTDVLPEFLTYVPGSASSNGSIAGNTLSWDLGDLSIGATGTVTYQARVATNAQHGASVTNSALVLCSQDDANQSDNFSAVVTGIQVPPTAVADAFTFGEDALTAVDAPGVLANDTDPDNDPLTAVLVTSTTNGVLTFNTNGSFQYRPATNFFGTDSFAYRASDGTSTSAPCSVTITVTNINDPPLISAGTLETTEDIPATFTFSGSDPDGDVISFAIVASPEHGTLSVTASNAIYTPAANYYGSDAFTYVATDGQATSAVALVSITVGPFNDPPLVNAGADRIISEPTNTVALAGTILDDEFSGASLQLLWTATTNSQWVLVANPTNSSTTVTFGTNGVFVLRLTADDGFLTSFDEVTVVVNGAPRVEAGASQTNSIDNYFVFDGTVEDDGLPNTGQLQTRWEAIEAPGPVLFVETNGTHAVVLFAGVGTYVLRLTATDSVATNSDDVTVVVLPVNQPPQVSAGPPQLVILPETASLYGAVEDDGLPLGSVLASSWSVVSGPGAVSFSDVSATNTIATFASTGNYVLRLTANDSVSTNSADVRIAVRTPAMNEPPAAFAGPDKVVGLTNSLTLAGVVVDDGLPRGVALTSLWTLVSGPGAVTFEDAGLTNAAATFSAIGSYTLRLTVSDSQFTNTDHVNVTVYPFNHPPVVDAGTNQTIIVPDPSLLRTDAPQPTNINLSLSRSLFVGDYWDYTFGQPGLTGFAAGTGGIGVSRHGLSINDGKLWVAGAFTNAGGIFAKSAAMWDGQSWNPLFDPRPDPVPNAYRGTNIGWALYYCPDGSYCTEFFMSVAARGTEAFYGGSYLKELGPSDGFVDAAARWSGTGWEPWVFKYDATAVAAQVRNIKATPNKIYLAGSFVFQPTNASSLNYSNLPWSQNIATWDGTNWGTLGGGVFDYRDPVPPLSGTRYPYISGLAVGKTGEVYVSGNFIMNTPNGWATNIAKWNGVTWQPLGSGLLLSSSAAPTDLALADNGDLYAGGALTNAGGIPVRNIARWDGVAWSPLAEGNTNGVSGQVEAIAIRGRDVYVGGYFTQAGSKTANFIALWNGVAWSSLGQGTSNGVSGQVMALACDDTGLYVGGTFTQAGGQTANRIAKWAFPQPPEQGVTLRGFVTDDGLPTDAPLSLVWSKLSGPGEVRFFSSTNASTSASFTAAGTYVLRLSASDTDLSSFDDVTIEVIANQPPVVNAGEDLAVGADEPLTLQGTVSDDALPAGSPLTYVWSVVSGPYNSIVTFSPGGSLSSELKTTISCSATGVYVLRLTANDSQFSASDEMKIVVLKKNSPPYVHPGSTTLNATFPLALQLNGVVTDDGLPVGVTNISWTKVSGPGLATFSNARIKNPSVTFSTNGTYVLRISADDTELSVFSDVTVTVGLQANAFPTVSAGSAQTISNLTTRLEGIVSDDGLPLASALQARWSKSSGPGNVKFADSNSPSTSVTFDMTGQYVLTLIADDGQYSQSASVTITVANRLALVNAGPDRAITLPTNSLQLTGLIIDSSVTSPTWTRVSGPGSVTFTPPGSSTSTALTNVVSLTSTGTHVLRLTAYDAGNYITDEITVVVAPSGNLAPVVNAGPDTILEPPTNSIDLNPTVSDDGIPSGGSVVSTWTKFAGPGTVTFSNPAATNANPVTTATFSTNGLYILRLMATDGVLTNGDDIVITVRDPLNVPPVATLAVSAGYPGGPLLRPSEPVQLTATVTNDALPLGGTLRTYWSEFSGPGIVTFTNRSATNDFQPIATAVFSLPGNYTLRFSADDGEASSSATISLSVVSTNDNLAPAVAAGADRTVFAYKPVYLEGVVSDDALPIGASLLSSWLVATGPPNARVYFTDANWPEAAAQFYTTGTYVLRLVANDGQLSSFDDVQLNVLLPTNYAPLVFAGLPLEVTRPERAELDGAVLDDGLPLGSPVSIAWSVLSGPGDVTFFPSATQVVAEASFSAPGVYELRLTASDSVLSDYDDLLVVVYEGTNGPPVISVASNLAATVSSPLVLESSVTDDGMPNGTLQVTWSRVSGPGGVAFSTLDGIYRAAFDTAGEYVVRIVADDGDLRATNEVLVTVYNAPNAPVVALVSPLDAAIITAPTIVTGVVESAVLQSYTLQYRLKTDDDSGAWISLATGAVQVATGPLGAFDPTLLLNGVYELQLTATDIVGRTTETEPVTLVVDRSMKVGHFTLSFNDLTVPVAGIPIQVIRTYDSRDKRVGDFGVGWTLDLKNVRLQKNRHHGKAWDQASTGGLLPTYFIDTLKPRVVTITFPDGKVYKFQAALSPASQFGVPLIYPRMTYVPLANTHGTLTPIALNWRTGEPMLDDQLVWGGDVPGRADFISYELLLDPPPGPADNILFNPDVFEFTTLEGYRYLISETNGLRSMTDPNGNTLLVTTNGLTWTNAAGGASLSVLFQRDSLGRITNILDAMGNAMSYRYDTNGNLVTFTDRAGNTNGFSYNSQHQLLTLTDARGIEGVRNEYDESGRLIRNIDVNGQQISYAHDIEHRLEIITNRLGFVTISEYDERGNVVKIIDPLGAIITSTYDANDNVVMTTDPLGRTNIFTYDAKDNRTSATDALGNTTRVTYNDLRRVTSATDARGNTVTNIYDAKGNLLLMRDPLGNVTRFGYSDDGLPLAMTNALGFITRFEYDDKGRLKKEIDALSHETTFQRDTNGNLLTQSATRTTSSGTETLSIQFRYDSLGRLTNSIFPDGSSVQTIYNSIGKAAATLDQLGRATSFDYDEFGRVVRTVHPDGGNGDSSAFDAEGRRTASTNRLGQVTMYEYDAVGRLYRTIYPDGTSTTNYFDLASQSVASTDARGLSSFYGYDAAGRSIAVTNALGQVSRSFYDAAGNLTQTIDALGRTNTFYYDALNRRTNTLFADGTSQSTTYDALGRRIAEIDAAGIATYFGYDALGRLTSVTNAHGDVTRYEYDELGQQIRQIDANEHATLFEYDSLGRRIRRTLPGGQFETYAYAITGLLTNRTDFNGYTTTFLYDVMNRLTHKVPDSRRYEPTASFAYNTLGLRTNMVDASGVTSYRYDNRNRLVEKATPQGTLFYAYDANGSVTNIRSSNVNGVSLSYGYDELNRLSEVVDPHTGRTSYTYDNVGNLRGYTLPNLVNTFYEYNAFNRLTNVNVSSVLGTIANYAYTVGAAGNRLIATETLIRDPLNPQPTTLTRLYGYDRLYRLTNETIGGTWFATPATLDYSYDKVGNRLCLASTLTNIQSAISAFDANDRLTSDTYDSNGNTTGGRLAPNTAQVVDSYDFENRLLNRNNGEVQIVYDGDGNRARKTVNGVTTLYLVDTVNPTGYAQVLEELTTSNTQPANVIRVYAYGHALLSQDQLIGSTWTASYYGRDGHGNVRLLTDQNVNVTDTYDYDAFGNFIARTGTTPNIYLFTGEQFDPDLGLYCLRARYHNPSTGRFWSMDTFEGEEGDPTTLHKYSYCQNEPNGRVDPSGNFSIPELSAASGLWASARSIFGATIGGLSGGLAAGYDSILHGRVSDQEIGEAVRMGFNQGVQAGAIFGAISGTGVGLFGSSSIGLLYSGLGFITAYQSYLTGNEDAGDFEATLAGAGTVLSVSGLTRAVTTRYTGLSTWRTPAYRVVAFDGNEIRVQAIIKGRVVGTASFSRSLADPDAVIVNDIYVVGEYRGPAADGSWVSTGLYRQGLSGLGWPKRVVGEPNGANLTALNQVGMEGTPRARSLGELGYSVHTYDSATKTMTSTRP